MAESVQHTGAIGPTGWQSGAGPYIAMVIIVENEQRDDQGAVY